MILTSPKDIGALIKERRIALDLDQEALARRAGTSRKWIVEIEKGKPGASLGLVLRTLRVLGVRLQSLTSESPARTKPAAPAVDLNELIDSYKRQS